MHVENPKGLVRRWLSPLLFGAAIVIAATTTASGPLAAAPTGGAWSVPQAADGIALTEQVQGRARGGHGGVARGGGGNFRGNVGARSVNRVGVNRAVGVNRVGVNRVGVGRVGRVGVGRAGFARSGYVMGYRPWARRAWWGTVIGGVALGSIVYATSAPYQPDPNLCWFWADPSQTSGYWDYCAPPY